MPMVQTISKGDMATVIGIFENSLKEISHLQKQGCD